MVVDFSRFPQKNENKNVKRKFAQDATLFKTFYRRKKKLEKKERKHECTKRSDSATVGHFLIQVIISASKQDRGD